MTANEWLIQEENLKTRDDAYLSTLFTLSNGLFGARGTSPLAPRTAPGTLFGGIHTETQATLTGIPALGSLHRDSVRYPDDAEIFSLTTFDLPVGPNLFALRIGLDGLSMKVPASASRTFDIRHGLLSCTAHLKTRRTEVDLRVTRFTSLSDVHLAIERIELHALTDATLAVGVDVDASVLNGHGHDLWERRRGAQGPGDIALWQADTCRTGASVAIALAVAGPGRTGSDSGRLSLSVDHSLRLRAGETAVLDRFIACGTTVHDADPAAAACAACARALASGYEALLAEHRREWDDFWTRHDIRIEGPADDQLSIRFCLHQLRACAPPPPGNFSVGPNFLAGPRYRACVFWDTDVFIMPYMVRALPEVARRHLLWRHRTLDAARALSRERFGLRGARYPWQAMADGREALAPWNIFAPNQVHIVGDVAWLVMEYYLWTGDEAFMRDAGREILAETARFWVSRCAWTARGLEILDVSGPDETHPRTHNNYYTNLLARRNLEWAAQFNPDAPAAELRAWQECAQALVLPATRADGVIPQCDGFLDLPEAPEGVGCIDGDRYQSVKQADVLMLPVMFPGVMGDRQVEANYRYYEPRTTHESSLSPGIHAIVAARIGLAEQAYGMFRRTVHIDTQNTHGNSHKGLHSACTGLAPRVVIEGFAGLRIEGGRPVVTAALPEAWKSLEFRVQYKGREYCCRLTPHDNGKTATLCETVG